MVVPFTPAEVADQQVKRLPEFVIEAVNEVLVKKTVNGYGTIPQDDLIEAICVKARMTMSHKFKSVAQLREVLFAERWLDFEKTYRAAGWKVDYDRPGYNESYSATFTFSK